MTAFQRPQVFLLPSSAGLEFLLQSLSALPVLHLSLFALHPKICPFLPRTHAQLGYKSSVANCLAPALL
jgi:hypothetical protein